MSVYRRTLQYGWTVAVAASFHVLPVAAQSPDQPPSEPGPRAILALPGGDTLSVLDDQAAPELLESDGEWVRVRLEGWMRAPAGGAGALAAPRGLRLSQLRAEPERYRGQRVRWRVQFLGVERADELRPDIPPGRTFTLLRDPGGEPGFVYALVPPALAERVATLTPLERIVIVGEIVTGRSELTGHPILEIVELLP